MENDWKGASMKDLPKYPDSLRTNKIMPPPPPPEPSKFVVSIPGWTTRKELQLIKLTAQSVAQHGISCWKELIQTENMNNQLGFITLSDTRFCYFIKRAAHYKSWTPTMISSSWTADADKKKMVEEDEDSALLDSPELAWLPLLRHHLPLPPRDEPEAKRQNLVPEDQFLSQHPGLSSIRVFVPKRGVVEITVQSLSEHVASVKEKIAEGIRIPATKHRLWGKAGDLEDNKTLAHYNVGAGEILILFWCL